jgi:endonuclease YncB( thermonuclease family)
MVKEKNAILFCFLIATTTIYAHPGRTDANGGHWDKSTNTYHYHNKKTVTLELPILEEFFGIVVGITDGDTLTVMKESTPLKVHLNGIDAPESSQAFGQRAKQFLSEICYNQTVHILVRDIDRYGRSVADISLPSGSIVNQMLVQAGFAWHYKAYSKDTVLEALEMAARTAKAGLWADKDPIPPWNYRY